MPAANQAFTEELTDTYTYEAYPLGTLRYEPASEVNRKDATHFGERTWVFVHNDEGGAFAKGDVLEMGSNDGNGTTGLKSYLAVKSNTTAQERARIVGIAAHAIADGSYGWVVIKGMCEVACDGSVSATTRIMSDTAGQATDVVVNDAAATDKQHMAIGFALELDAGAGSLVTAIIDVL